MTCRWNGPPGGTAPVVQKRGRRGTGHSTSVSYAAAESPMLDVSTTHPFAACAAFAVEWLGHLAAYDLKADEGMIDVNESGTPLAKSIPAPDGFTYGHPDRVPDWTMHILNASDRGLTCDFDVPFAERGFRAMMAQFHMRRTGDRLEVRFLALVPT